jgi:hypothetical protein
LRLCDNRDGSEHAVFKTVFVRGYNAEAQRTQSNAEKASNEPVGKQIFTVLTWSGIEGQKKSGLGLLEAMPRFGLGGGGSPTPPAAG